VLAISAMLIAPTIDTSGSLYIYLQQINATFFGPMLAVILCGLLVKRVTARAAKTGLVVGPIIFYLLNFSLAAPYQALLKSVFGLSENMHFLHTLAIVFLLTLGMMLLMSRKPAIAGASLDFSQAKPVLDMSPWRLARPTAVIISVAAILFYILLAQ
jgi:SSS family solute:Na+ symporter